MRFTIFGGGGFIGSAIVERLLRDRHTVRIFERPRVVPYRVFGGYERVEWIDGDFLSTHDVSAALDGAETVIHLVSTTLPKNSNDDPVYDVQTNVIATVQLLNQMVAKKIPRIVFISSGGTVYGTPRHLPIDETHPTDPHTSYGITKLTIEKYLLLYQRLHGLKPVILRVANPYGERQRIETAQGAVAAFIRLAMNAQPIEIWGDGRVTRDFLHVVDVADAFALAAAYTGEHAVFNIGSGVGTSINELVRLLERLFGTTLERIYKEARAFDVPTNVLNNRLARDELGWMPRIALDDGVKRTIEWNRGSHGGVTENGG